MRAYVQSVRAQQTADTEARIVEEAERLFSTEPFDRVTLASIAGAAGVTIPTVQRRFGNKDGVFAAVADRVRERVDRQRSTRGDLRTCIRELVDHYEQEGRLMWHMLRQEQDVPLLQDALPEARAVHRRWVETVFAAVLEPRDARQRRARIDALVAATDLFVWKLLRIDLGRSRVEVEAAMLALAGGS